jgi:hypothetical protein
MDIEYQHILLLALFFGEFNLQKFYPDLERLLKILNVQNFPSLDTNTFHDIQTVREHRWIHEPSRSSCNLPDGSLLFPRDSLGRGSP